MRSSKLGRRFRRLLCEVFEDRRLLASDLTPADLVPDPAWFGHAFAPATAHSAMAQPNASPLQASKRFSGPRPPLHSEWIVRLSDHGLSTASSFQAIDKLLESAGVEFETERGLGVPGQIQVRAFGWSPDDAQLALEQSAFVSAFAQNSEIELAMIPNDPEFGNLLGLQNVGQFGSLPGADISAVDAWDTETGSRRVVVGVIDSGIDATHPDLFANIWLNQGEIPVGLRQSLSDVDGDELITLFDLNDESNSHLATDLNGNGYVDAVDLLLDPRWSDGVDTEQNGFIDDFFGWNFRGDDELFAPNNPSDSLGHGTHVAGIIGAMGNNAVGVSGVNWQTSLMSLKFLDQNNRGDVASAIAAINYATMMRTQFDVNVRVLNNSWGQPGAENTLVRNAIEAAGEAGMLVLAAAGNGNALGVGVDNDRTPFYPASYDLPNVIAVAASDRDDRLAAFSNYGANSVDLVAPGVGILSTLPGGRYGEANGTSMATPFVAGVAALIWSALPQSSVEEVRRAVVESVDTSPAFTEQVVTGGRLNAASAVSSDVFAPVGEVIEAADVTLSGGSSHSVTVEYRDRSGLSLESLGDDDIHLQQQWGERSTINVRLRADSVQVLDEGRTVRATYDFTPPGGSWDALDFGSYSILSNGGLSNAGGVRSLSQLPIAPQTLGQFTVRIEAPTVLYVDHGNDGDVGSLRTAIAIANANPTEQYIIILTAGAYRLSEPPVVDPAFSFMASQPAPFCSTSESNSWSGPESGDLDILGKISIVGDSSLTTLIDAQGIDRVLKVHEGARLELKRVTITGGRPAEAQGGAGILSAGSLSLEQVVVRDNLASTGNGNPSRGGGVAAWGGQVAVVLSQITNNQADLGGGLFVCGNTALSIAQSTIETNQGGGILSYSQTDGSIENTTLSRNVGPAIASRQRDYPGGLGQSLAPAISGDGTKVVFRSSSSNLVASDNNAVADVFLFDTESSLVTRQSVSTAGDAAVAASVSPAIDASGANILFVSQANNLVPGDAPLSDDLFLRNTESSTTRLVSTTSATSRATRGTPAISSNGQLVAYQEVVFDDPDNSWGLFLRDFASEQVTRIDLQLAESVPASIDSLDFLSMSGDGRFVTVSSKVSGTSDDNLHTAYLYDRVLDTLTEPAFRPPGATADGSIYDLRITADGNYLVFTSDDTQLVANDTNQAADIFVFALATGLIERVSVAAVSGQANGASSSPSISGDGRYVAFSSSADNLVSDDLNGVSDIFVRDRLTGSTQRIAGASGIETNAASYAPALSHDGRFIAFESDATNLIDGSLAEFPPPTQRQVFLFDQETTSVQSVSAFQQASTLSVTHATVVFNTGNETLAGNIALHNTLSTGNFAAFDFGSGVQSLGNNLLSNAYDARRLTASDVIAPNAVDFLRERTVRSDATPGYPLLIGSPAIDRAGSAGPMIDQWSHARVVPDIGALEAVTGSLLGTVYADINRNDQRDVEETGVGSVQLFVDLNRDGLHQTDEPTIQSSSGSATAGGYEFTELVPGDYSIRVVPPTGWQVVSDPISRVGNAANQPNGDATSVVLGPSGSVLGFASLATNLIPGQVTQPGLFLASTTDQSIIRVPLSDSSWRVLGFTGVDDRLAIVRDATNIYLFDRVTLGMEVVSRSTSGSAANAHSNDAASDEQVEWLVFSSFADNIVPGDVDTFSDIFLLHRPTGIVESITRNATGSQGNNDSEVPTISRDGRYITFVSDASNLVPDDTNSFGDIFLYDRVASAIQRINQSPDGEQSNAFSYPPTISGNGRYVLFQSLASNLVAGDDNNRDDLFLYDLQNNNLERLPVPFVTSQPMGNLNATLSDDGQYVLFDAPRSALGIIPPSNARSVFVFDRSPAEQVPGQPSTQLREVSLPPQAGQPEGSSLRATFSRDGRTIAFTSSASNLVANDTNGKRDVFVAINPFEATSQTVQLGAGQLLTGFNFGILPEAGQVSGTIYEDLNNDQTNSPGEPGLANWTVFLDANENLQRDAGEQATVTDASGGFAFSNVPSFREYRLAVEMPLGWERSTTDDQSQTTLFFVAAAGNLTNRDLGFKRRETTGQSTNASITGTIFRDLNGDGVRQTSEAALSQIEVYLDLNNNLRREFNEPRVVTGADGSYSFAGLGSRDYTVRVVTPGSTRISSPVGNEFSEVAESFSDSSTTLAAPEEVLVDDFDGINGPDLAISLYAANMVVIKLNDGHGNFTSTPINVPVSPGGQGPAAMVSGQLNGNATNGGGRDLVVANALNGRITVFLDFNGTGFASESTITLGAIPTDLALVDVDDDDDLDLLVIAQESSAAGSLRVFVNNGSGQFSQRPSIATGGKRPTGLVALDANGDGLHDIAVVHQGDNGRGGDVGNVTVLFNAGNGQFFLNNTYVVGNTPSSIDAGDLNGDGRIDLAVTLFATNTLSILAGAAGGSFTLQPGQLSTGTGPIQVQMVDIDGDQDRDILVGNLNSGTGSVSILRNRVSGQIAGQNRFDFEPAENYGLAQFSNGRKLNFAPGDFDASGTIDLAIVDNISNQVRLLNNNLVGGAHRLQLTGIEAVSQLNFGLQPIIVAPRFDAVIAPSTIDEDSLPLTLQVTNIQPGTTTGPELQLTATIDNAPLFDEPVVQRPSGSTTAQVILQPRTNANGNASLTITARNAGADQVFGSADDGVYSQTLTLRVRAINDPPSFQLLGNQLITVGSPLRTVTGFATNFLPGGGSDEQAQELTEYIVVNDRTDLFRFQPTIDNAGNLRFEPTLDRVGIATVQVQTRDNGGTEFGGQDRSAPLTFQIQVSELADDSMDFGDAPTSQQSGLPGLYPSLLRDDGARHRISSLFMGTTVDAELNGQPMPLADGDDADFDDEDGVHAMLPLIASPTTATTSSLLVTASATSRLDAWIDFNQDGDWLDSGEQIIASYPMVAGNNVVSFTIPAGTRTGSTFSRFRLSSTGGLGITGLAEDGEVEDHPLAVTSSQVPQPVVIDPLVIGAHELLLSGGQLVVRSGEQILFSVPATAITAASAVAGVVEQYSVASPADNLTGVVRYAEETVSWLAQQSIVDIDLLSNHVRGVQRVELTSPEPQQIRFTTNGLFTFGSGRDEFEFVLGSGDRVSGDLEWLWTDRSLMSTGFFEQRFERNGIQLVVQGAGAWQNALFATDVNGDGFISPADILAIVNFRNRFAELLLPEFDPQNPRSPGFLDVNGDGNVAPLDILFIVNYLNRPVA